MKQEQRATFFNQGHQARENNQLREQNPYKTGFSFTLSQRLFYTRLAKQTFEKEAKELWYSGWDKANEEQTIVNERIQLNEATKAAQERFAIECVKDHERLSFLLNHFLKRNGGYIDLQVLAALRVEFGDHPQMDIVKFKLWIDNEIAKQTNQERKTAP
jgi:ribosomal protein L17